MAAMAKRRRRQRPLAVRDWFTDPRAEEVARRNEVWALLRWYHDRFVDPHRGLRGFARRLWWRVSGQRHRLLSPWEQLELRRLAAIEVQRAAELDEEANGLEAVR